MTKMTCIIGEGVERCGLDEPWLSEQDQMCCDVIGRLEMVKRGCEN
jgi:hypothetical protein